MAKSKQGPALFELIRGERRTASEAIKLPSWLNGPEGTRRTAEAVPAEPAVSRPRVVRPDEDERESGPRSMLEYDGPVLRVSLTSKSGALVLFALLLLVAGVYAVGRSAGRTPPGQQTQLASSAPVQDEIEQARNRPPATHLIQDGAATAAGAVPMAQNPTSREPVQPAKKAATPLPKATWVKGNTYIVVQEFNSGQQDDAKKAMEFLSEHGIGSSVITLAGGAVHLITTEGYNTKDPSQKSAFDDLLKRVRSVGEKYFAAGGRYRLQGYAKTLTRDSW